MNLIQMAASVCLEARQTAPEAIAVAKGLLAKRYELLCQETLWKDLLYSYTIEVGSEASDSELYRFRPNSFELSSAGIFFLPNVVDRLLAIRTTDYSLAPVDECQLSRVDPDEYAATGAPVKYALQSPCVAMYLANKSLYIYTHPADAGGVVRAQIIEGRSLRVEVELTLTAGLALLHESARIVERITKPVTSLELDLTDFDHTEDFGTGTATMEAFPTFLPVKLLPAPTVTKIYRCLVKKKNLPLVNDGDEPELRGVTNALLAFGKADLLKYGRQYGKAQMELQEGIAMLGQLKLNAAWQEANRMRYVPEVYEASGSVEYYDGGKGG